MRSFILIGICATTLLGPLPLVFGQNLLQDPTFLLEWDPQLGEDVERPLDCGEEFLKQPISSYWPYSTGIPVPVVRNGSQFVPACPRPPTADDREWGSIDFGEPRGRVQFWQTVTVTEGQAYLLSGVWAGGTDAGTPMTFGVELREGDENGRLVGTAQGFEDASFPWESFEVAGTVETGTALTVVFFVQSNAWGGKGLHVDDLLLEEGTCTNAPSVNSINPNYGVYGGDLIGAQITGSNFVVGGSTPVLRQAGTFITGTNVNVDPSGESLTCNFDLGMARLGYMDVAVQTTGCPDGILRNGLLIVMPGPGLSNPSFESPPVPGPPSFWTFSQFDNYGGGLYRDENVIFAPSSPPAAHGIHYASTSSDHGQGTMRMTQTVAITPSSKYFLSGYFAGGGDNEVKMALLDGGPDSQTLSEKVVSTGTRTVRDWTFDFVVLTPPPTNDFVTARWEVHNTGSLGENKSAHADYFSLTACTGDVVLTAINPPTASNSGPLTGAEVTGSGFSGGNPPDLMLARTGKTLRAEAGSIVVGDDNNLTCNFNLTGLTSGYYDLVIAKDGCFYRLEDALVIVTKSLSNGEFEEPASDLNCGVVTTGAAAWNYSDESDWWRDHNIWLPTCPRNVPEPDPLDPDEHGHYQSMTGATIRDVHHDQRAWQVLSVNPPEAYRFSGYFAGGGGADVPTVKIKLVDGPDPQGASVIAATIVDDSSASYDWKYAEVQGRADSDTMTVVWEMTNVTGTGDDLDATHADGLKFEPLCDHDPFADTDEDGDVDHEDFAVFQICYTGSAPESPPIPSDPWYCTCLDRGGDDRVSTTDLGLFEQCASGPEILADICCDGGPDCD